MNTQPTTDSWLTCLLALAQLHHRQASPSALTAGLPLIDGRLTPELFIRAAERAGLAARQVRCRRFKFGKLKLPVVLFKKDGGATLLVSCAKLEAKVWSSDGNEPASMSWKEIKLHHTGDVFVVEPTHALDARAGEATKKSSSNWFWHGLLENRRTYFDVLLAALFVNLFTLATPLYVMNVYDRVVPNQTLDTLWAMTAGILLVLAFDFLLRMLRAYFLDVAGKRVDTSLSATLFAHVLAVRPAQWPASSGSLASTMREFETLRDFVTSATLTTLVDLPFLFLFIAVIWMLGGELALIPLMVLPLVIVAGLLLQIPLAREAQKNYSELAQKQALLVEAVEGMEAIKVATAEGAIQAKWEGISNRGAASGLRSRFISTLMINFTATVQQLAYVATVVWGVILISQNRMTVGSVIACSILVSRGLAPVGQIASLMSRFQSSRAALRGLSKLMHLESERPEGSSFLHRPQLAGDIVFEQVSFHYPAQKGQALKDVSFKIATGERVAILGKIGSGKSTLQRLVLGLYHPDSGSVQVDGSDVRQIDPADLRRNIAYVSQEPRLFYGTLRENIALGRPGASDDQVLAAARAAGVDAFIKNHPSGYGMAIGEGGKGLSGGQRQAVNIARALMGDPPILLFDEPTGPMDYNTEQVFINTMRDYLPGRTLVLVTHKPSMLILVDRIIVLDGGAVVADGPRDKVMQALTAKPA